MTLEPGIYKATVRGVPDQVVMVCDWHYSHRNITLASVSTGTEIHPSHTHRDTDITDASSLTIIDLGSHPRSFARLLRSFDEVGNTVFTKVANQIDAQCPPPRIEEPGLWGVVEANVLRGPRVKWLNTPGGWHSVEPVWSSAPWDSLIDPTLIRAGFES